MIKLLLTAVPLLLLFSCQKERSAEDRLLQPAQVDVYVAGYEDSDLVYVAKYWKNGAPVTLGEGYANAITVSGNDVYVCGTGTGGATYWKNGTPVTLGEGYANSIAVSGNDVYVAGGIAPHAVYWKNGNKTYLPENTRSGDWADIYPVSSISSHANSIFISGADIYIAGGEEISRMMSPYPDPGHVYSTSAVYWKNGKEIYLIKGPYAGSHADAAYSIFVASQDVYACGALSGQYWKNGNPMILGGTAKSIFVSDGDIYVAGTQTDGQPYQTYNGIRYREVAKYWKNGNPVNLTDGTRNAFATSIAVTGSDVYVAGYEETTAGAQDYVAKYWKNGNPVILGEVSKHSRVYSIFLAKH